MEKGEGSGLFKAVPSGMGFVFFMEMSIEHLNGFLKGNSQRAVSWL